jgi:hypothetical protein
MVRRVEKGPGECADGLSSGILAGTWRDISSGSVLLRDVREEGEEDIRANAKPVQQGSRICFEWSQTGQLSRMRDAVVSISLAVKRRKSLRSSVSEVATYVVSSDA